MSCWQFSLVRRQNCHVFRMNTNSPICWSIKVTMHVGRTWLIVTLNHVICVEELALVKINLNCNRLIKEISTSRCLHACVQHIKAALAPRDGRSSRSSLSLPSSCLATTLFNQLCIWGMLSLADIMQMRRLLFGGAWCILVVGCYAISPEIRLLTVSQEQTQLTSYVLCGLPDGWKSDLWFC